MLAHAYLGTIANPGTWRVLIDGSVTREWASTTPELVPGALEEEKHGTPGETRKGDLRKAGDDDASGGDTKPKES